MSSGATARKLSRMPDPSEPTSSPVPGRRPRRLPATGLPAAREGRRTSSAISLGLHLLIIFLIAAPAATHTGVVVERLQGAGGLGPAGGGGGGKRGSGGVTERVTYIVPAAAPAPAAAVAPVIPPPTPVPPPKPVEQPKPVPPPEVKPLEPTPEVKTVAKADARPADATAPTPGTGGGTGNDGSNGTGPGSGGGTGSGIGTGRGSGTGPGTGGGVQANYPPTAIELFIPPLPVPSKVRGFHLVAEFDVDETGKVVDWKFNSTGDGGYDRKLNEALKGTRFRPGTTPDGKPIRMKAQIIYDF
jgi:protein TonB